MKTRQELILDFMLALAPNYLQYCRESEASNEQLGINTTGAQCIWEDADALVDEYLNHLG
jgi:hypothetical protein